MKWVFMTNENFDSKIVIQHLVLEGNGKLPPRWRHSAYVGNAKSLHIVDSLFIKQKTGHHIKSRTIYTEVTGTEISEGTDGNASYSIDVSAGGVSVDRREYDSERSSKRQYHYCNLCWL